HFGRAADGVHGARQEGTGRPVARERHALVAVTTAIEHPEQSNSASGCCSRPALGAPMTALLPLARLPRRFGGVTAVESVSMNVEADEIRGLIGPNGAGKTTTLDLISGLTAPTSGRMMLVQQD